jgi:periplasmic protein TonB
MNHRFTLPVAVALAVHAMLLFGFSKSPVPKGPKPIKPVAPETIFLLPPEKPEPEKDPRATVAKGSPDVARPEIEDTARPAALKDFTIPVDPARPALDRSGMTIDVRSFGHPEGDENSRRIDGGPVVSSGLLDNPPAARVRIPPDYPFAAKQAGLEGRVMVEFSVDETGRVFNPSVVNATDRVFEESTVRAVSKWRFEPGKRDGRPVRFRMAVPVLFSLAGN